MSHTEQDDSNTTGPIAVFVAALPPHVRRVFRPNGNSIPQLRALADKHVDLALLARVIGGGLKYRTGSEIQKIVTHRVQVAVERESRNPSANMEDSRKDTP